MIKRIEGTPPVTKRVHQPDEAGPVRKFSAADAVINVDMLVGDAPPFARLLRASAIRLSTACGSDRYGSLRAAVMATW